ncbi:hypothetical protein ENSA5_42690 [Enhygromyxa salina]|uniref:Uncharacterized protein n=1 Tax=Enhygromyxa salina TaxID=215803 RepID=A0A2S9XL09_9BACT|nr:hypothetical protein [Enhygromyxa salina]PRP93371.1 hypothetical protein ENSA5_42690 [Enhygromyxa salina]
MSAVRTLDDALAVEPGLTCLDRATLLANLLSWRDAAEVDPRVSIRVRGSSDSPRALSFVVRVRDEVAVERRFEPAPDSCADLHAVVALAIAIALDDTLATELGLVDEAARVEQARPGEGDLPSQARRTPPPPRRRGPALALTAAAGAFAGLTPGLSGGGELSLDLRPLDHFDLRFGALATHLPGFKLDEGRVGVTLAAGRLDLCWGTAPRVVRLRTCGGVAAGASVSVGRGYTDNFRRAIPWLGGIAAVDLAVHLVGPLALELRVEGVFPFHRTRIDVRSTGGQLLASERFPVAGLVVAVGPRFEF